MCLYLCECLSNARTSLGPRFHKYNSLPEPRELCFNILREFLNREQLLTLALMMVGRGSRIPCIFLSAGTTKRLQVTTADTGLPVGQRTDGGDALLVYSEMLKVNPCFYSDFTLQNYTELSMLCTAYSTDCSGMWQGTCGKYTF